MCLCTFGPKSPREATACGGSAAPVPYVRRATDARRRHEEPENEASTAVEVVDRDLNIGRRASALREAMRSKAT